MNKKNLTIFILLLPFWGITQRTITIIPQPVSMSVQDGYFIIDKNTSLVFKEKEKDLRQAANFFNAFIKDVAGYALPLHAKKKKTVLLEIKNTKKIGDEGYLLNVSPTDIKIVANTKAGIIYGMQSLIQTLPQIRTNAALTVPCMKIMDYPRFKWRGMHLDVSRHFFSPDVIKEYIDLMAAYKFNTFHWHLCDAQGWRLEIKKYPKLTSAGAWRPDRRGVPWREIQPSKEGEIMDYGGYYTQEQVKNIVAYARERNITIVPEIEMPGHSAAALSAYPYLSCTQQPQLVPTARVYPGIENNYCVGNDSVFTFLENVLTEVMQLFPSKYIHVGGDEVNKTSWKACPKCQALKNKLGLKDENELQSYFIRRIEKFLIAHHRKLIGWDEILEGGLAPEATVMSWRGEAGGIQAAKMHHDVVMSPGKPLYFDKYQIGAGDEPPAIGGLNTLKMVYDYNPVPKELDSIEAKYILGGQANVWTEFISTAEHLEYMVLPRMLALSEAVWTPGENKNYADFYRRLQNQFKVFDQKGYHYCSGNFNVAIKPVSENGKLFVTLSTEIPDASIYYTTDGRNPDTSSHKYTNAIAVDSSFTLKAVTVVNGKVISTKTAERKLELRQPILNEQDKNEP